MPDHKIVCAWCSKTMREGIYPITHGICELCRDQTMLLARLPDCPVCGHRRLGGMIKLPFVGDGESTTIWCEHCSTPFTLSCKMTPTYQVKVATSLTITPTPLPGVPAP